MPKFFVPDVHDREVAEGAHQSFVKIACLGPLKDKSRLYQVSFPARTQKGGNKGIHTATVGKHIYGWREKVGQVLAILEMHNVLCIHTELRGGIFGVPILVSTDEASCRVYFDDYPASV